MQSDPPDGGNRRAHQRLPLRLDVRLSGSRWKTREGQIRDYCPGGVFLACPVYPTDPGVTRAPVGDRQAQVALRFRVPDDPPGAPEHVVEVRVSRMFESGLGLAFVNPGQTVLDALERLAVRAPGAGAVRTGANPPVNDAARRAILDACRARCVGALQAFLARVFKRAEAELVRAAGESRSATGQQRYFDALGALESGRHTVGVRYAEIIATHFTEPGGPLAVVEDSAETTTQAGGVGLSLVDKHEFEGFLVVSELTAKLEATHERVLRQINHRFANVCDVRIVNETNPVGPDAICHGFRAASRSLRLDGETDRLVFGAFARQARDDMGAFYLELDRFLEDRGLPAESRFEPEPIGAPLIRPNRGTRRRGADRESGAPAPGADPEHRAPGRAWRARPDPDREADVVGGELVAGAGPGDGGAELPAGLLYSRLSAPHQIGASAAFGAAQALMGIRRAQTARAGARGHTTGAEIGTGRVELGAAELVDAISRLPLPAPVGAAGPIPAPAFKDRVLAALAEHTGTGRRIEDEALDVIDVVEDLFAAFADDPYLADPMKRRVARLEAAVQRGALLDAEVLTARDHPVRRLFNALDEVDVLATVENGKTQLEEVVDPILDRLIAEHEHDPGAFALADDLVATVLEGQRRAYEANVARVVKLAADQQAFVSQRRAGTTSASTGARPRAGTSQERSQEWSVWLGRVRRLQVGDVVEFAEGGAVPRRGLKLAWVADDRNTYVFVNRRGAKDASLSLQELAMYLRRGLAVVRDRPELPLLDRAMYAMLHRVHGRIERQASHDDLTGLANRRTLDATLARALKQAAQDPELEHALCHVELDDLGEVERRGGEQAVEAVIREAAGELERALGPEILAARVDAHALGFLIEDIATRRVPRLAQRVQRAINDRPYEYDAERYFLRARVGIARLTGATRDARSALEAARHACRDAAPAPGRLHVVESADEDEGGRHRPGMMNWVTLINRTLGEDRMQLRCQRVQPLTEGQKPYFEVLLGLRDGDDRAIPAGDFIGALEYYEQMAALDRWVIRNALKWMAANRPVVRTVAGFTVKLTRWSLVDDHLMEYILEQLTATSVPPGKICFEITDADALAHATEVGRLARTLREFGCRFSLSKFGNGSGLSRDLQSVPVDFLKVDGRFVQGMSANEDDLAVVHSATHLAHASGIRIVAEFVEDARTLTALEALGVDLVQGLAIEAPRYLSELEAGGDTAAAAPVASAVPAVDVWSADLDAFLEIGPHRDPSSP